MMTIISILWDIKNQDTISILIDAEQNVLDEEGLVGVGHGQVPCVVSCIVWGMVKLVINFRFC